MHKYLTIFLVIIYSCKGDDTKIKNNFTTIVFSNSKVMEDNLVNVSEIVDTTIFVKLETKKECLIGRPSKIKVVNDHIFVLDSKIGLFEFDIQGNFIQKIGSIGKGPGQYISPLSFDIEKSKKLILIYDRATRKILKYDFDGVYKKATRVEVYASNFVVDNITGDYIFDTYLERQRGWRDNGQYSVTKTEENGEFLTSFLETNLAQNELNYRARFNLFNNDTITLYNIPFNNDIYRIQGNEIIPFLRFKFNGKTIPERFDYNINIKDFMEKIEENTYEFFNNNSGYFLINNKILFTANIEGGKENYIYNLDTETLKMINKRSDLLDIGFLGVKTGVYKNSLVNFIQTEYLVGSDYFKSEKLKGSRIQEIVNQSKEGDNPIIIFNKFR